MLVMILHAILMWQQSQNKPTFIADGTVVPPVRNLNGNNQGCPPLLIDKLHENSVIGFDKHGCYIEIPPAPPFDVSPVETRSEEERCEFEVADGAWHGCMGGKKFTEVHISRVCADKSRFLLMSEDGRWHCLALGQKP